MNAQGSSEKLLSLDDLLRDLSVDLESDDFEELRGRLRALDHIEEELAILRENFGYQVIRGSSVIEELTKMRSEGEDAEILASDYIVRKDNVELLVEVQWDAGGGFLMDPDGLRRLQFLLSSSSKSEEIVIVWGNSNLDAASLSPDQIYSYLSKASEKAPVELDQHELQPLRATVEEAFSRYRRVLRKPEQQDIGRAEGFSVASAFRKNLAEGVSALRNSLPRRRLPERKIAISSISDRDLESVERLFVDAAQGDLDSEELGRRLEEFFEGLRIDASLDMGE